MPEPISSTTSIAQGIASNLITDWLKRGVNKIGRALVEKTLKEALAEELRKAPNTTTITINVLVENVIISMGKDPRVEVSKTQIWLDSNAQKPINENALRKNIRNSIQSWIEEAQSRKKR